MFISVLHLLVLCPFIFLLLLAFMLKRFKRTQKRAIHRAIDVTTFILLFSIQALCQVLYDYDLGVLVQIVVTLIFMMIVFIKWRENPEIKVLPIFKKFWRVVFLVLSTIYMGMLLVYVVLKAIELF